MASLFDGIALEALVSKRIIGDHEWTIEDVAALCHQLQCEVKGGRVWHHGALKIEREFSESITLQHKATTSTLDGCKLSGLKPLLGEAASGMVKIVVDRVDVAHR